MLAEINLYSLIDVHLAVYFSYFRIEEEEYNSRPI